MNRRILTLVVALLLPAFAASPTLAAPGWSHPVQIVKSPGYLPFYRGVAVADGVVHVVTTDRSGFDVAIRYRRSTDGGKTWSGPKVIFAATPARPFLLGDPSITALGNTVAVAFRTHRERYAELFVRVSHDGGLTWANRQLITTYESTRRIGIQTVAASEHGLFVSWTDRTNGAVYVRRSEDFGETWRGRQVLGWTTYSFFGSDPWATDGMTSLMGSGDDIYVMWSTAGDVNDPFLTRDIVIRVSRDGGRTYGQRHVVVRMDSSGWPAVASSGGTVLAQFTAASGQLMVARSADHGATFSAGPIATPHGSYSYGEGAFALGADGTSWISYTRFAGAKDPADEQTWVMTRHSGDGGATWTAPAVASGPKLLHQNLPTLALVGGHVLIVFNSCSADYSACGVFSTRSQTVD